jgi:hypothetical protein
MVLDTISSIQSHFLKLYCSGTLQCKLGYDSSLACDSFQLGQMVKFFSRVETLRLQSAIWDESGAQQYSRGIERLIESLRKCPEYQVDHNHSHCGLRTRILPILDWVQFWLDRDGGGPDLGLCLECWKDRRMEYAWTEAKRPLTWRYGSLGSGFRMRRQSATGQCSHKQSEARDMFIAVDRDWNQ